MSSICRVILLGVSLFRHKESCLSRGLSFSEFGTHKEGSPKGGQHASAILFVYAEGSSNWLSSSFPS